MWILSGAGTDLLWLYAPGLLAFGLSFAWGRSENSWAFLIYALIAQGVLDGGHVYATLWRTYLDRVERRRRRSYLYLPILVFVATFLVGLFSLRILGAIVLYTTIYHNVRQFYGLSKWYQRLNRVPRPTSDRFLYALCFLPVVMAHFRAGVRWPMVYLGQDLMLYPSVKIYVALTGLYVLVLLAWSAYEFRLWSKCPEPGRALSVGFPALLYGFAFLHGNTLAQILFPLVVSHGVTYLVLTSISVRRIGRLRLPFWGLASLVFTTAAFFGTLDFFFEGESQLPIWAALFLTPLFCHYLFDGFLWTRRHPDADKIYLDSAPVGSA